MSKTLTTLSALALSAALAWPAMAQETPDVDQVLASVNGEEITLGHMILVYAGLPDQYRQLPPQTLWDGILEQLVQQTALSQADDATETKRVRLAMDNERRALLSSEVLAKALATPVSEDALRAAYDARVSDFEGGNEFNASHILVETEEEAQAIVAELEGGADFAALAREKSTGPSGPSGGTLGWFGPGMMVAPFEEAVAAMDPETISGPVQTQFGWHVIRLNEVRNSSAPAFEEVRAEIAGELRNAQVEARVEEEVAKSEITIPDVAIDPSVLSQLQLLED